MNTSLPLAAAASLLLFAPTGNAGELYDLNTLALSWGTFGIADTEQIVQLDLEWRMPAVVWNLRPVLGGSLLHDGGNYAYGGLRYDYEIGSEWSLSSSFAIGLYSPGEVDLGGPLEFRSGLDISYRVTPNSSFGIGISHLSNAGIYSRNGGSESLIFTYTLDL
jgi:lipid A 3-O-deacylase